MRLCIIFRSLLFYLLLCYGKKFALSSDQTQAEGTTEQVPQLYSIEVDITQKESTSEFIYNVEFDGAETFVCRKGYVIRGVYKGNKTIWEYSNGEYPDKVYILIGPDGKKTCNVRYPYDELVVEVDLKVKESNEWVIYQKNEKEDTELFICKTGYLIEKVVSGPNLVWQWQEGSDYPNRVVIARDENGKKMATVRFPGDDKILLLIDVAIRQSTNEVDYVTDQDGIESFIPKPGYLIHRVEKNGKFVWECEDGVYPDRINIVYDKNGKPIARFRFPGDAAPAAEPPPKVPEREGIPLDLTVKEPSQYFNYIPDGNVATYRPYDNYGFHTVLRGQNIWSTTDKMKYATLVVKDGIKWSKSLKNVTLHHLDGTMTHLTYEKKAWKEASNELILNIKNTNTVHHDYSEEHDLGVFTPKHDCVFKSVILDRKCSCGRRAADYNFWHAGKNEFSRRIVTNYHFNLDRVKHLSVFLNDGTVNHYRSRKHQRNWEKISHELVLDLKKQDNTYSVYYAAYDQLPTYVANYNFVFTSIVNGGERIWQGKKGEFANLVYTDRTDQKDNPDNLAIVLTDDRKILLKKSGGGWVHSKEFPGFDLDILEQYSTTTISYAQNMDATAHSFTTKNIFLIKCVKDEDRIVWNAPDVSHYARKVIVNKDNMIIKPKLGDRVEFEKKGNRWEKKDLQQ